MRDKMPFSQGHADSSDIHGGSDKGHMMKRVYRAPRFAALRFAKMLLVVVKCDRCRR